MAITEIRWNSPFGSDINRDGIPKSPEWGFDKIFDLDYICEQIGGNKIGAIRLPFSPYLHGTLEEHAETLYRARDILVHNVVRGYYSNSSTSVFSDGSIPEDEIVRRFEKYYGFSPRAHESAQPSIGQVETSILESMHDAQSVYENRDVMKRLIRIVSSVPEGQRAEVASVIVDRVGQFALRH